MNRPHRIICFEHEDLSDKLYPIIGNNIESFESEVLRINKKLGWDVIKKIWNRYYTNHYVRVVKIHNVSLYILPKIFAYYNNNSAQSDNQEWESIFGNFLYVLNYAGEFQLKDSDFTYYETLRAHFHDFMIFIFAKNFYHHLKDNFIRDYKRRTEELSFIKGKIIFKKNIQSKARS